MICARCQTTNNDTARFCSNCGKALEAQAAPRQPEGERKLVTVLFADVVGSTAMGERLDPEQVTDVMNGAFAFINGSVDRYGGTVSRLMGDAVLAIFGAPISHEDDPERAIRAGLEMLDAAADYAAIVRRKHGQDFHIRVGLHTGVAVLDQVGDRIRTEYTAMGDTPNVAARMQSAAAPGTVLVSGDTYRLARHAFDFEARGPLEVKGKSAPIDAWRALAVKAARTSARGLEGLRAPMVGREAEVERLRARLRGLRPGGSGGLATLSGEAGLGKSRLVAELHQFLVSNLHTPTSQFEIEWLEGHCISYGHGISYLPWRQIIRQTIGALEGEPVETVRARLESAGRQAGRLPAEDLPFLEAILGIASQESLKVMSAFSGEDLVRRITEAFRRYLRDLTQATPLVIVLEDLHWADDASTALLENVCDLVPLHPMLIICLMRPDKKAHAWALAERARQKLDPAYVDEITLEPLSAAQARDLLGLLLHIEDLPDHVRGLILERAEGNPFFVEEVIRSLLDSGLIVRADGHWRATRQIETVAIPNTLAGLLAARIDALPGEAKRLAQMSAVIGRSFAYRVIETVCAAAPPDERIAAIQPPLDLLAREEIVKVRAREPELEYTFKHALTQEAAYNSLLIRRRREFHGRAGQALETVYASHLDELAPTLAYHFWQAEDWERAHTYAMRAGDAALRVYALREAIRQYDRAIEALDKAGGEREAQVYDAIMGWARAAFKFRPYPEQVERLARAEQIARRLNDKRRLAEALHATGAVHQASGRILRAIPVFSEAFTLAEELGDEALTIVPSFHAAFNQMDSDPRAALPMFDRAIGLARKYGQRDLEAHSLSAKGLALARLGRFSESQELLQAAIEIVHATGSPVAQSDVELLAGWAYLDMDDPRAALEHGQRGVECAIATDNFDCICGGLACVGFGHMQARELPEAAGAFEEAIKQTKVSGAVRFAVIAGGGLALAQMAGGQPSALAELEQATGKAREVNDPFTEATFSHAVAEAHLAQGDLQGAQAYLDKPLDYFRRNDMRPYLARAQATQAALREKQEIVAKAEKPNPAG
jgi:class 3 adenylate cyclase/tetratricopeptide (TPR) repeat protein